MLSCCSLVANLELEWHWNGTYILDSDPLF
jgi:hypothetical protein